jgi:hypothetical protein
MLAFNGLGNNGRLGNQMFQYAALKGIARRRGYDFCIPPFDAKRVDNYSLHVCFNLTNVHTGNLKFLDQGHAPVVVEKYFHYDESLHHLCPDDVSLFGFFQSEKWFKDIEDEIREDFTFDDGILGPCKEFISEFEKEPVFLHVRRGDPNLVDSRGFKWAYVNLADTHPVQPIEYYENALKLFDEDQPILVFSDSPEWVKEQELFTSDRFFISEPQEKYRDGSYTPYVDLCLMSLCSGAIIANSSLSWWGAWLQNKRGKVVAPKMWFGPAYADKDTKDLYCDTWEVI